MAIPIPIPIGIKRSAVVRGAVWKLVDCEHCGQRYACQVQLEAVGEDVDLAFMDGKGSAERARAQAMEYFLKQTISCIAPIPCPQCGCYQEPMARQMKENAWVNRRQIVGGVIAAVSLVFLALPFQYMWVATVILAAVGLHVMTSGYISAYRYDPNAGDPEPRRALARSHAVWGEKLQELIVNGEIVDPNAAPVG